MWSWKSMWMFLAGCLVVLCCAGQVRAQERAGEEARVVLGSAPDEAWLSRHVGDRIKGKVLRGLVAGDQTVVLYQQQENRPGGHAVRLSVLDGATERRLWEYADGEAVTSGQVPPPLLAACQLNGGSTWDIILCASVNEAGGKHNEKWTRHLRVFLDGVAAREVCIPLAAVDKDIHVGNEADANAVVRYSALSDPGQPALERDACVIVKPAAGLLILVSTETRLRSEREEQEPRPGPVSIQVWRCDGTHVEKREGSVAELTGLLLGGYGGGVGLVLR